MVSRDKIVTKFYTCSYFRENPDIEDYRNKEELVLNMRLDRSSITFCMTNRYSDV